jgi:hypothetical protein
MGRKPADAGKFHEQDKHAYKEKVNASAEFGLILGFRLICRMAFAVHQWFSVKIASFAAG